MTEFLDKEHGACLLDRGEAIDLTKNFCHFLAVHNLTCIRIQLHGFIRSVPKPDGTNEDGKTVNADDEEGDTHNMKEGEMVEEAKEDEEEEISNEPDIKMESKDEDNAAEES